MTSTATPTGTSTSAAATATVASCGATLYDIPVQDASCAIAYGGNHTDIMRACCGSAAVVAYADNCGLYCLAEDKTVAELATCMEGQGAAYGDVFCRGTGNATATATGADASLTSGASVVASGTGTATGSSTKSGSSATGTGSSSSGAVSRPAGLSLSGLGVGALLFSSVLLGAFQL